LWKRDTAEEIGEALFLIAVTVQTQVAKRFVTLGVSVRTVATAMTASRGVV